MVNIVLLVSRDKYLRDVFDSLNALVCDLDTNLFVYVDGDLNLFKKAREHVRRSKFKERLCVYRKKGLPNVSHIFNRRKRIGEIHDEIKNYIKDGEFIFLVEDDTLVPSDALELMLKDMWSHSNVGFISGVELGRWGFLHIGAWRVDDINDPRYIYSITDGEGLDEVDAAGLYCCLTRRVNYISGMFKPFEKILGPDFTFGIDLRCKGFTNYVNKSIKCTHKTPKEDINFVNSEIIQIKFDKIEGSKLGWELGKL